MRAVILASGRGSRLAPLTDHHPKPLLPLANTSLLGYLLQTIADTGITEALVTLGYLGSFMERFLTTPSLPLAITPVPAPQWPHGPLGALQAVLPLLDPKEMFLLVPADLYLTSRSLQPLLDLPGDELAILYDPHQSRTGFTLRLNKEKHIIDLTQDPSQNTGHFPLVPALRTTSHLFEPMNLTQERGATTVFELLQRWVKASHILRGVPIPEEFWIDVDTPHDLLALNQYLLTDGWPPAPLPSGTYLPPAGALEGPMRNATLRLGTQTRLVGPVLLGDHVQIGNKCLITDGTSLGSNTTIHDNVVLRRCITFPQTNVPHNADLTHTILDAAGNILHTSAPPNSPPPF